MPLWFQAVFLPQHIVSVLLVPVFIQGEFWGFVGVDDSYKERVFTSNEEMALRSASLAIVSATVRCEQYLRIP